MTVILFPKEYWKHSGMVLQSSARSGQWINGDSLVSITLIHDENILEIVAADIPNQYARSWKGTSSLNFNKTIIRIWNFVRVSDFLVI